MGSLKSGFGLILALVPILYVGYLLYYFIDVSGSFEEMQTNGLGPTILGLGIIGLLFCIPFIVKLVKAFRGPRSPGSGGRGDSDNLSPGEFDPDAVIARYMARQPQEAATAAPSAPRAPQGGGARPRPASFGRRAR